MHNNPGQMPPTNTNTNDDIEASGSNHHPAGPAPALVAGPILLVLGILLGLGQRLIPMPALPALGAIYLAMQWSACAAAVCLRDKSPLFRWIAGFCLMAVISGFKTAILTKSTLALVTKVVVYAETALWDCSNVALVFGGRQLQERFGVSTHGRALIYAFIPCQARFISLDPSSPRTSRTGRRALHIVGWAACALALREVLRQCPDALLDNPVFEAVALTALMGSIVVLFNAPALLVQLWLDASRALRPNDDAGPLVEVILPYGSVLLVRSTREFWSRWSRPATQLIRRLVYYPLGGPARPWLSVPVMFLVNGAAHYDVSGALVGDKAVWGWNAVFWTMGAAATLEIYLTRAVSARWGSERGSSGSGDEMLRPNGPGHQERRAVVDDRMGLPGWFKVARACIAYACGTFAAHTMLTRCLHLSIRSFL